MQINDRLRRKKFYEDDRRRAIASDDTKSQSKEEMKFKDALLNSNTTFSSYQYRNRILRINKLSITMKI